MSLRRRPIPQYSSRRSGPPVWIIFLVGIALVLGGYYIFLGVRNFLRAGGLGVAEATQAALIEASATQVAIIPTLPLLIPTLTPVRECIPFVVSVPSAIIRSAPSQNGAIIEALPQGSEVCVIERTSSSSDWFLIDQNTITRRVEAGYMNESVIEAVNPTLTPTLTPRPSITPSPTDTPTQTVTPSPRPTATIDFASTDTPTPTVTPSPTQPIQSA
jgi:hypothetical protein